MFSFETALPMSKRIATAVVMKLHQPGSDTSSYLRQLKEQILQSVSWIGAFFSPRDVHRGHPVEQSALGRHTKWTKRFDPFY